MTFQVIENNLEDGEVKVLTEWDSEDDAQLACDAASEADEAEDNGYSVRAKCDKCPNGFMKILRSSTENTFGDEHHKHQCDGCGRVDTLNYVYT